MSAAKKKGAPAPRPRSGFATEEQRHTKRVVLRVHSLVEAIIKQRSAALGINLSEYVSQLVMADLNGKSVDWRPSDE